MPNKSGGRPQGQLGRALARMTVGTQQGLQAREEALRSTRSGEYDQQVQEQISGLASDAWGYDDIPVSWEHPFLYSPLQRDPPFLTPHVSSHIEFTGATGAGLVIAHAHVIGWRKNPQGWFIGATVRVAVSAPGGTNVPYTGIVHLIFQGFAYPTDEELTT